jgi:alkanesulfonate monooxygenase SsuD/methylene tetrahydromethanopterin reductase-like flavin-dependent oxidoreductase (luciferase family)
MFSAIQALAAEGGRDPAELELIVRGNVELADQPLGDDRMTFMGTTEQVAADISATRDIGASELIMDATFDPDVNSAEDFLGRMELLFRLAEQSPAGVPA